MTNEAPERDEMTALVNFLHGAGPNKDGQWFDDAAQNERGAFWWRKYLRQIERLAVDHLKAAVAAEREACAEVAQKHLGYVKNHHPDDSGPDDVAQGYGNASLNIREAIRARTDADALAALEQVKREAYERGVRDAADRVSAECFSLPSGDASRSYNAGVRDAIKAILDLLDKEPGQ